MTSRVLLRFLAEIERARSGGHEDASADFLRHYLVDFVREVWPLDDDEKHAQARAGSKFDRRMIREVIEAVEAGSAFEIVWSDLADLGSDENLDDFYSKVALSRVPKVIRRLKELQALRLGDGLPADARDNLREAVRCYVLGLPVACTLLCRSTLELSLRARLEQNDSLSQPQRLELLDLIRLADSDLLSKNEKDKAHRIRKRGNEVAHRRACSDRVARDQILDTRDLICSLYRP